MPKRRICQILALSTKLSNLLKKDQNFGKCWLSNWLLDKGDILQDDNILSHFHILYNLESASPEQGARKEDTATVFTVYIALAWFRVVKSLEMSVKVFFFFFQQNQSYFLLYAIIAFRK